MNISEGNDNYNSFKYSACNMSAYNNTYNHFVQPELSNKKTTRNNAYCEFFQVVHELLSTSRYIKWYFSYKHSKISIYH